jgi:hypothetical protein
LKPDDRDINTGAHHARVPWLGFLEAFRTFCVSSPADVMALMAKVEPFALVSS